ncbi:general secretion pathway protein D [Limimonas halophila]|uniref:General secretion pathway protein D n=1 Tax=Limimonas halophila TaxID=1082479 RepID=A0A1G7NJ41_9PROT|nr:type II secretion system secretin GspD [Limimonas halophila]SDF74043.1 general secretion pathway protein D [Limimonas halophila]
MLVAFLAGLAGCTVPEDAEERRTLPADAIATDTADKAADAGQAAEGEDLGDDTETETLEEPEVYTGSGEFVGETRTRAEAGQTAGGYTLNFVGADLREVVDAVLGEALGVNYSIHSDVGGAVTARTTRPLTREQVVPALEDVLAMNGAAVVEKGGMYHIVPLEDARVPPPIGPGDTGASSYGTHIIPVNYVSAAALKDNLDEFVTPGRTLRVDRARNLLLFVGPGSEAGDLAEMVDLFDVDWMKGKSFALLPLDSAAPKRVVTELRSVFGRQQGSDGTDVLQDVIRFMPIQRMNAVLVITKQRGYLERARTWVERLDRGVAQQERKLFVYDVDNARAQDLARVLGQMFSVQVSSGSRQQQGTVAPGRQSVSLSSRGNQSGTGTGTTGSGSGAGTRGNNSSTANTNGSDSGSTTGTGTSGTGDSSLGGADGGGGSAFGGRQRGGQVTAQGGPPVQLGNGRQPRIIADTRNNALLVLATGEQYQMIRSTLDRLDQVPLQVVIEATIAEVRLEDELQYGLRFFFEDDSGSTTGNVTFSDLSSGGVAQSFPGFSFLLESGDTRSVLNALSDVSDVNVISSPHLMVLNNQSARIQVGDEVPVATRSAQSTTDPDAPVVNQIEFRNTGTILEVSPHVNESGLVTLDIRQEVSDVTQTTTSGLNSPTIQQREITSNVAVQSGQTIALGGLIEDSRDRSEVGVPLLKDIPYVGNAFKNVTVTKSRTELLVLLTPRVVHDQQEADQVTRELRRRLEGVKMFRKKAPNQGTPSDAASQSGASSTQQP